MNSPEPAPGTVLIRAPLGKDTALAAAVLEQAAIPARICSSLTDLGQAVDENAGAVLLAEEALVPAELPVLLAALDQQPPWSDLPVLILTSSGGSERMSRHVVDLFGPAGNVTLLERPLHGVTLLSAVRVTLRARRRQYQVRDLLEQRERLLSSISDAFSAIDHEWRYTYVNDRVAELVGRPKESMIGRKIWEMFPEAVGGEFYHLAHRAMNERRPVQAEFFHEPWGRWIDARIYPTKDGIAVFRADITERKEQELAAQSAQAKLRESEDLLRLATEAAAIGTFDYYPRSGELRFSPRAKELYGLPPDAEPTYETYLAAIHPEDRHIAHETVQRVLQPGSEPRYDIEYRTIGHGRRSGALVDGERPRPAR